MLDDDAAVKKIAQATGALFQALANERSLWRSAAQIYATLVSELVAAGFSREEAMRIACAYGIPTTKG